MSKPSRRTLTVLSLAVLVGLSPTAPHPCECAEPGLKRYPTAPQHSPHSHSDHEPVGPVRVIAVAASSMTAWASAKVIRSRLPFTITEAT